MGTGAGPPGGGAEGGGGRAAPAAPSPALGVLAASPARRAARARRLCQRAPPEQRSQQPAPGWPLASAAAAPGASHPPRPPAAPPPPGPGGEERERGGRARAWGRVRGGARAPPPPPQFGGGERLGERVKTEPFPAPRGWALTLPLCEVWAFLVSSGGSYWWGRGHLVGKRGGSSIADEALNSSAPPPEGWCHSRGAAAVTCAHFWACPPALMGRTFLWISPTSVTLHTHHSWNHQALHMSVFLCLMLNCNM